MADDPLDCGTVDDFIREEGLLPGSPANAKPGPDLSEGKTSTPGAGVTNCGKGDPASARRATVHGTESPESPSFRARPVPVVGVKKQPQAPSASSVVLNVASKFKAQRDKAARRIQSKLPPGVNIGIPGITTAWYWFQLLDADNSGVLEKDEVKRLGQRLGLQWTRRQLNKSYDEMCLAKPFSEISNPQQRTATPATKASSHGVDFRTFAQWWSRYQAVARRDMRRTVKELFQKADRDGTGILDRQEFEDLLQNVTADKELPTLLIVAEAGYERTVSTAGRCTAPPAQMPHDTNFDEVCLFVFCDYDVFVRATNFCRSGLVQCGGIA